MEEHNANPLRFETNPYHNIVIKDRKVMELTGVKQIDSFDANEFLLETAQGWLMIQGKDLKKLLFHDLIKWKLNPFLKN